MPAMGTHSHDQDSPQIVMVLLVCLTFCHRDLHLRVRPTSALADRTSYESSDPEGTYRGEGWAKADHHSFHSLISLFPLLPLVALGLLLILLPPILPLSLTLYTFSFFIFAHDNRHVVGHLNVLTSAVYSYRIIVRPTHVRPVLGTVKG